MKTVMNTMNSKQGLDQWLANPHNAINRVTREFSEPYSTEKPRVIIRLFGIYGGGYKVIITIDPEARHKKQPHKCKCFFYGTCVEGAGLQGILIAEEEQGKRGGFFLSSNSAKELSVRALVDDAILGIDYQFESNLKNEKNHPPAKNKLVKGAGFVNVNRQRQVLRGVAEKRASQNSVQRPKLALVK